MQLRLLVCSSRFSVAEPFEFATIVLEFQITEYYPLCLDAYCWWYCTEQIVRKRSHGENHQFLVKAELVWNRSRLIFSQHCSASESSWWSPAIWYRGDTQNAFDELANSCAMLPAEYQFRLPFTLASSSILYAAPQTSCWSWSGTRPIFS